MIRWIKTKLRRVLGLERIDNRIDELEKMSIKIDELESGFRDLFHSVEVLIKETHRAHKIHEAVDVKFKEIEMMKKELDELGVYAKDISANVTKDAMMSLNLMEQRIDELIHDNKIERV